MKKFVLTIAMVFLLSFMAEWLLPWWILGVTCAVIGFFAKLGGIASFLAGFIGAALLWGSYAFYIDQQTAGILTHRIADLLQAPNNGTLILITALIGGLVGGMACLTGFLLRRVITD